MGYELNWEGDGVTKRFFDHVSTDDFVNATIDVEANHRFDHIRWVINDFLEITGNAVEIDHVEEMAAIDKAASLSNSLILIAVVATDPNIIAMAHHYATSPLNIYQTRIFSTLSEARQWLGLKPGIQTPHSPDND